MRIAWLLLTRSGRSNWNRLAMTMAAVALGMLMVLLFMAGVNGLEARAKHSSWQFDLYDADTVGQPVEGVSPLRAKLAAEDDLSKWQNKDIRTVSLRPTSSTSLQLPGLSTPKEGEYYVSRGLDEVLRAEPDARIGERFGSRQIGIIPDELSASPDALEVIRGMSEQEANGEDVATVYRLSDKSEVSARIGGAVGAILISGATILLFPIIMFISIATQLGSAQREKRYAALRLIGATRKQVTRIIALESLSAAVIGIIVGSLACRAILPLLTELRFEDMRFWQSDLTVPLSRYLLAISLTLAFCLLTNWWGMRHVQLSALGIVRAQKITGRPRMWRLLLFIPGIAIFIWLALPQGKTWFGENISENGTPLLVLLAGIVCVLFGLILAGPWFTSAISRLVARRTRSATTLLATKRIAVQSRRVFRSVSGVVLALFAGSFFLTSVSGIDNLTLTAKDNGYSQLKSDTVLLVSRDLPENYEVQLKQQSYIKEATEIEGNMAGNIAIMPCRVATLYTTIICPQDASFVGVNFNGPVSDKKWFGASPSDVREQLTTDNDSGPTQTPKPASYHLVQLDSNENIDQLRTHVVKTIGLNSGTLVISGTYAQLPVSDPMITELAGLAYAGMAVTLFVAIASLIVSTMGGLLERQRSFVTLRLGGMTVKQMKRTVVIESLIPLISVSLFAAGLGVWVGSVFTRAMSDSARPSLTSLYFVIVGGSLIISVFAIRSILPMLDKITRPEENQTE